MIKSNMASFKRACDGRSVVKMACVHGANMDDTLRDALMHDGGQWIEQHRRTAAFRDARGTSSGLTLTDRESGRVSYLTLRGMKVERIEEADAKGCTVWLVYDADQCRDYACSIAYAVMDGEVSA